MRALLPAFLPRAVVLLLALALAAPADAALKAIVGGTVLDGLGSAPIRDGVVLIDGERIRAVGPRAVIDIPAGTEIISAEGMTVLPGLWDLQVHLTRLGHANVERWNQAYLPLAERVVMPLAARQLLLAGVTSARDVETPLEAALDLRARLRSKRIPGPTLYVSGPSLTHGTPAGPWQWSVANPAEATAKARRLAEAGVDYLLLDELGLWSAEELGAAIGEARLRGVRVYARTARPAELERALAARVDGILGIGMGAAPALPDTVMLALNQRMAAQPDRPLYWSPAVSAVFNYENLRLDPEALDDPASVEGLPPVIATDLLGSLQNLDRVTGLDMPASRRPTLCTKLGQLRDAGVTLVTGSDAGLPAHLHSRATWQEIDAWVRECRLDPLYAIQAATHEAAVSMGAQSETGALAAGLYADVIAVRGNVLLYPALLRDPTMVLRRGQRHR